METITLEGAQLMQGISTNAWVADGGYSPKSKGINPHYEKGVLHFQPARLDLAGLSSNVYLDGNAIAMIVDPNTLSNLAYVLSDAGTLYTVNGSYRYDNRQTDSGRTYAFGDSDMKWFNGALYVTSQTNVAKATGANLTASFTADWWTATAGNAALTAGYRHPIEVVEDTMYIADFIYLHTLDTAGTDVAQAMTMPMPITEMVKHPNGRDLIVFCAEKQNYSGTERPRAAAYIVNTIDLEFTAEIPLDDQVHGARVVGGIVYVGYGQKNLGYFSDNGIVFLRELEITTGNGDFLPYKHHMQNMEGHLVVAENNALLALGDLGAGKCFYYPYIDSTNGNDKVTSFLPIGSKRILYGKILTGTTKAMFKTDFLTASAGGGSPVFYTNRYSFPKKAWIRRVDIIHKAFASGQSITAYSSTEADSDNLIDIHSYTVHGAETLSRFSCNVNSDNFQLGIQITNSSAVSLAIRKVIIYYELGED